MNNQNNQNNQTLSLETIINRSPDHLFTEIDDEIVLFSSDSENFYGFDRILSIIWGIIEEPISVSSIIEQLLPQFDVEASVCTEDVLAVLQQMKDDKLIVT